MNRRPKQPVETVRAWAPWTLLGLALAEVGLSIFQWVELRTVQAGRDGRVQRQRLHQLRDRLDQPLRPASEWADGSAGRRPRPGVGTRRGGVRGRRSLWRARTGRALRPAVLPVRTVGAVAALVCITLVAGSISAGALCLTCLGTYALVLGYAGVAFGALPGFAPARVRRVDARPRTPGDGGRGDLDRAVPRRPLPVGPARSPRGARARAAPAPRTSRSSWPAAPSRSGRRSRTRWPASRGPRPRRRSTCCPGRGC